MPPRRPTGPPTILAGEEEAAGKGEEGGRERRRAREGRTHARPEHHVPSAPRCPASAKGISLICQKATFPLQTDTVLLGLKDCPLPRIHFGQQRMGLQADC
ncbi:hypothetical protein VULLAG_LOCUS4296 [Vulpes lagopus]